MIARMIPRLPFRCVVAIAGLATDSACVRNAVAEKTATTKTT